MYKRMNFVKDKFTLEFVSMADYYNVEDLVLDCTEYLKKKTMLR